MKTIVIILLAAIIFLLFAKVAVDYVQTGYIPFVTKTTKVTVNNTSFTAEIADTPKKQEVGLSQRKNFPEDRAMLFPFGKLGIYPFWMKNMKFPIDILFISNGKIVTIYEDAKPAKDNEPPQIYSSQEPADTVLEINAGLSKQNNIKTGDEVKIQM